MSKKAFILFLATIPLVLAITGCRSGGDEFDRPLSRREYEYIPPARATATPVPTPTPEPTATPVPEQETEEEAESAPEKRGFFGRLFSRGDQEDSPEVTRVGDRQADEDRAMEDGESVTPSTPSEHVYKLKNGDTVYITLTGSGGLNEQIETRVDDEGAVKLRYIGAVKAAGRSTTELEREIEIEYTDRQKIYKDITVRATVPNTFYFIGGEVRQAGRYPLMGRVTLSQAVVAAGNFTEWANPRRVILVRNNERVEIDFRDIQENPNRDFELLAGDVIRVSRSTF